MSYLSTASARTYLSLLDEVLLRLLLVLEGFEEVIELSELGMEFRRRERDAGHETSPDAGVKDFTLRLNVHAFGMEPTKLSEEGMDSKNVLLRGDGLGQADRKDAYFLLAQNS